MMAIHALERITGERLGYNPYASLSKRRLAVERWGEAVKTGQFGLTPPPTPVQP
jgi:hypothetical protein